MSSELKGCPVGKVSQVTEGTIKITRNKRRYFNNHVIPLVFVPASFLTSCSKSLPADELSNCVTAQARIAQQVFAKGIPQLVEPLDPLTLNNVSTVAGTFSVKSTNVVVKGLKKLDIKEMR